MRAMTLSVGLFLVVALSLALASAASAQGPDVGIAELDCDSDPEVVKIENRGDASQALDGWQLQSDPTGSEVFDLTVLGGVEPGASVLIQSGPSASGVFRWSADFIFRDGDASDYARIVDDTGAPVDEVACAAAVQATPTPSPTPTQSPPADVPNGGGPPPPVSGGLSPLWMIVTGGSMIAGGLAAVALPWSRTSALRQSSTAGDKAANTVAASRRGHRDGQVGVRGQLRTIIAVVALVALVAAVALALLSWREYSG